jgi:hypothetical protein
MVLYGNDLLAYVGGQVLKMTAGAQGVVRSGDAGREDATRLPALG